jgi:hypothetical protein
MAKPNGFCKPRDFIGRKSPYHQVQSKMEKIEKMETKRFGQCIQIYAKFTMPVEAVVYQTNCFF